MQTAIIISKKDPAGLNIKEQLINNYDFKETSEFFDNNSVYLFNDYARLYTIEIESIFNENIDKDINADLFIFATKHQSKEGIASLSCHALGNWAKAEFGGHDKKLCIAPASYLKEIFLLLKENGKDFDGEITLEVTHHGPYLEKPCFFIEIGSSEEQWKNKEYGRIIAKTIFDFLEKLKNNKIGDYKIVIGIGGMHYANNFNKIMLNTDIAIGHICPKYMLENLDNGLLLQAIKKTKEKIDFAILDWKGLGKEKQRIINILEESNISYKRIDKI